MRYMAIRNLKQTRKDGTAITRVSWVHKTRKYGDVINEQNITAKRNILITGAHDSGKTRQLERLFANSLGIWGGKRGKAVKISGLTPLSQWVESYTVRDWYEDERADFENGKAEMPDHLAAFGGRPFSSLKQYERADLLIVYIKQTKAVLFVDDCHKLTGRKLDIARNCITAADKWVIAASEETRLPTSIRNAVLRGDTQDLRLSSDSSYDATAILTYLMIAVAIAGGWYEAAFILGGLKALGSGRRASRAD